MKKYDFIIIGSGPVTMHTLKPKLKLTGQKGLVIESNKLGGTCPNYGCQPKIFLEGATRLVLASKKLLGKGLKQPALVNWKQLMKRKQKIFNAFPARFEKNLKSNNNIDIIHGIAKFASKHSIQVNNQLFSSSKILIATGQKPQKLPIKGYRWTADSNDALNLKNLPKHILIIGGGPVGMELASLFSAAGSEVEIIEQNNRTLLSFNSNQAKTVTQSMEKQGVKFHLNQKIIEIFKQEENKLIAKTNTGLKIEGDYIIDASGRIPNIGQLNLEKANIKYDKDGILVNDHLMTNTPGVFAAGDVIKKDFSIAPKLTPTSDLEGSYISKLFSDNKTNQPINYPAIAQGVFAFPEIAQVGVSLEVAKKQKEYYVIYHDLSNSFRYQGQNDDIAQLYLIFDKHNQLVGASEVSQSAVDDINYYVPLIGLKISQKKLYGTFENIMPSMGDKLPIN